MCVFTGEVGDKESAVGHISYLSMLCISIYLFHYLHVCIPLSPGSCRCFFFLVHTNVRGRLLVKAIKMDGLFVHGAAQIVLYSSVHSKDGWMQRVMFHRVTVCAPL